MSLEWNDVVLKDVLSEKGYIRGPFGSALKRAEMKSEGIPVYEQQNAIYDNRIFRYYIDEEKYQSLKRFTTYTDDLIISCSGTVGKVSIIKHDDPKGIISQALLTLRVNKDSILPEFLKYFFSSYEGYNSLVSRSTGSVQVNISKRAVIEEIPLKLPPLDVQRKIVHYLSLIDKKIETNKKINKNLEELMHVLFKKYFIDNNPFYVENDEKWNIIKLKDLIIRNRDKINDFDNWKDELLIDLSNMPRFSIAISNFDKGKKFTSNIYKLNKYDLLFGSIRPYFGKVGFSPINGVVTGTVHSFKPIDDIYYSLVLSLISSKTFINYTVSVSKGTKMPSVKWDDFINYEFAIPDDLSKIGEYNKILLPLIHKIEKNILEIQRLTKLRDTLLPKLMSGEIDVSKINCDLIIVTFYFYFEILFN